MISVSLRRIANGLALVFEALAEIALVSLLLLVAHEVFRRYLLNDPTQYSVELSEYLLVLISFFATAYVLRCDRHVRVRFLIDSLAARPRAALEALGYLLLAGFCVVVTVTGVDLSWTALASGERSSSLLAFPLWIPYAFIPAGAAVLGLQCLVRCADAIHRFRAPEARE